jgi:cupin fold WbuC family metalloprotein
MKKLNEKLFLELSQKALLSPRKRTHFNLHEDLTDPVQRLCIAMEPGSYARPHKHGPEVWELFIIFKGSAAMLVFDNTGKVIERAELREGKTVVVEIAKGVWHTLVATSPNSILMEIKPGPYTPPTPNNFAAWAPAENTEDAASFEEWFRTAIEGSLPPSLIL